ncbi:hypothetical protein [Limosilactobacillus reuteri]|uniref:hypothetical protein n=1 Tax=Limosilactobacillus reuteri TaxID=1598 RepID=UPI002AAC142F|nr:hypothetical protein [Limosilactobacillus reuteri]WPU43566.1 hypothetical protein SH603_00270 [Limosilactobacillus reuteri]
MKMNFSENGYYLFNKKRLIKCLQQAWGISWKEFVRSGYDWDGAYAIADFFDSRKWKYKVIDPDNDLGI